MKYRCFKCGEEVDSEKLGELKCPHCGSRILKKKEREEIKKVKAR